MVLDKAPSARRNKRVRISFIQSVRNFWNYIYQLSKHIQINTLTCFCRSTNDIVTYDSNVLSFVIPVNSRAVTMLNFDFGPDQRLVGISSNRPNTLDVNLCLMWNQPIKIRMRLTHFTLDVLYCIPNPACFLSTPTIFGGCVMRHRICGLALATEAYYDTRKKNCHPAGRQMKLTHALKQHYLDRDCLVDF
ncbi:hypothetical protein CLF_106637 [Clonorchis sinensis]|uniref:Uncharacterized protein n=1 Tax=Clonorchis sinensis TaxID=79923 RepID=G7YQ39_CLOSI|nr:hypothetical protein CLF_106637 [Clonorchis sinensis]